LADAIATFRAILEQQRANEIARPREALINLTRALKAGQGALRS